MLSLTLSRLFRAAFWIYLIFGAFQVVVQFRGKPIEFKAGNGAISWGHPYMMAGASRLGQLETTAPQSSGTTVAEEILQIKPAGTGQRVLFAFIDLAKTACLLLLLHAFTLVFKNLHKKLLITKANIVLAKRIAWCLIVPQIVNILFYWFFLSKLHMVQLASGELVPAEDAASTGLNKIVANYQFQPGMDWRMIMMGLGMIVVAQIFLHEKEHTL